MFFLVVQTIYAGEINTPTEFKIHYFYAQGCVHCANVVKSGILDRVENISGVEIIKHDVAIEPNLFFKYADIFHLADDKLTRTPILFLIHENKITYLAGDTPIINELEGKINNFSGIEIPTDNPNHTLTLGAIIIASLIDSINPCAFGVLIFLLVCLLNMGSAKRALKYGLLYCFVVFITYFLAGLGLFKVIQSLTGVIYYVHLIIGLLSVCLGLIQVIDIIFPGKFVSLRIPQSTKPLIEKLSEKTTIPAVMLLGFLVSLFELPCTGGVYIAILATMSINKTFAIGYLLLYNFIFVLPLIAITLFIYKGTKPEVLQKWTSDEKIWMKLSSGLVMLGLGVYLLWSL
jgi:cytochrome c biogenesis protein CcdA